MELARVLPASPFSAGSGLPGRELTPAEERAFARRRRAMIASLAALALAVPVAIGVIVVLATEPRVDRRIKRYNSGGIEQVADWVGPVRHGPFVEYFTNGVKRAEGAFANNQKHGLVTTWFWTGAVESRVEYREGIRHGRTETFWPNGGRRAVEEYRLGVATGQWQAWSEAGALESEAFFLEDQGSFVEREFWDNGQLRQETPYLDGVAHGRVTAFWPNGWPMTHGMMIRGVRDGLWPVWDEAGLLLQEERWQDGERVDE